MLERSVHKEQEEQKVEKLRMQFKSIKQVQPNLKDTKEASTQHAMLLEVETLSHGLLEVLEIGGKLLSRVQL